ncbi:lactate dehydrogenase [Caldisalinibacter kiritimatiensis]|uniref:L-lactate dehydrogenase n=1 Tax=Caldisalinibacter kiritimatiensis TaxID=1304284 RepID=R1AXA0_9FIRM|nr:lactate dehydrogenase [Caldisalinibacter kiritimatiensis]EOD01833.1 L-lactate dehydrogenase [Caldisalinibacter kiritimatiensis]
MFYYYKLNNKILFSSTYYPELTTIDVNEAYKTDDIIYYLNSFNPLKSRRSFCVSDPSLLFIKEEGIDLLQYGKNASVVQDWILSKINNRKVMSINTNYPNWTEALNYKLPQKWKVNLLALGDVGGTLLTGLRLLGGDCISEIGIYDRKEARLKRWEHEINQVMAPFENEFYPEVKIISKEQLFDCDMFIFCASRGVPPVGNEDKDVRMVQFEGNSEIISEYAKLARKYNFKGIFAVVTDPVDLLCKVVFLESNKNESGKLDFEGLSADQIRGYGLGVMNARAAYYAKKSPKTNHYIKEGRAFGPHGEGLVIADSIENYNEELSLYLTEKARTANLEVRKTGFKPYIAPALSSGTLSIINTIKGKWHYSATYMGGVYIGANNRLLSSGTEVERLNLPTSLFNRIKSSYKKLEDII